MSPRRMDISSLLRDPSPPRSDPPRSIDALIHHPPSSLLSLLNRPDPSPPPPILGFDALVHAASEERRRINAASGSNVSVSFPHRRVHDSPHRSPSPDFRSPFAPTSPSHHSASPISSYPTLRRPPFDSPRSAPALSPDDSRPLLHPHTSPYLPSFPQPPRNVSPHRHSPQLLRSHHYPSPTQSASASTDPAVLSPRYSLGPRMAGGIEVLSHDPSSIREQPRPDLPNFLSTGRDVFPERLASESRTEHPWQETPRLSPLSAKSFSPDDRHQLNVSPRVATQETILPRDRTWPRLPHSPLLDVATTDDGRPMGSKPNFISQPLHDHRPTRVWEEQPRAREIPRRVSPPPMMPVIAPLERPWSTPTGSGYDDRSPMEDQAMGPSYTVQESAHASLQPIYNEPPPSRSPTPDPVVSDLPTPFQGSCTSPLLSPPPMQSELAGQSESQTSVLQPTACMPASPTPDVILDSSIESEFRPKRFDSPTEPQTNVSLAFPDPIITGPSSKIEPVVLGASDVCITTPLAQDISAADSAMSELPSHRASASQSTSRSHSQQPLSMPLPTKDEEITLEVMPVSTPIRSESPRRPLEPGYTCKQELSVSEQSMMDVDEELLSLVEDRPLSAVPTAKVQIDSSSVTSQAVDACTEAGLREAVAGPLSTQPVIKGPLLIADEEKDRASMPPPAARGKKGEKAPSVAGSTGSKKKKDGTSKTVAKPKQPTKPRAKPTPKPKIKPMPTDTSSKGSIPKNSVTVNARSRSASVVPGTADDIIPEPEADDGDREDDKLYCVCKTRYDEDRTMIACDRCDEWFHTQCVGMPELEIDLVDQFICPPCIQKYPLLRTTWKQRCLFGLQHENPLSSEACHKPARGAFSKYCTDECGIKHMRTRIAQWETSGGTRDLLWESVKNAAKREGVVVRADANKASPKNMDTDGDNVGPKPLDSAAKRKAEREVTRLNARLDEVVKERELMKRELDMVTWREKVVELASERAGKVDECGWDQRLCFGEEEWADFGSEVLESYEEERTKMDSGEDSMALDGSSTTHGEWWCTGKKKCERHAGWQKLRAAEVSFDKDTKEGILLKLTTREREIRKRIEDILFPQPIGTLQAFKRPLPEVQLNGSEKPTGHVSERGKRKT